MTVGTSPAAAPRKVMVVADPTQESATALQYALSHGGLTDQDELILLHVDSPSDSSWRTTFTTLFRWQSHHYHQEDGNHLLFFHSQNRGRGVCDPIGEASSTTRGAAGIGGSLAAAVRRATVGLQGFAAESTDFLEEMKSICELDHPKIRVRIERMENKEGKEKAAVVLDQSDLHGVDAIIVGQRRSLSTAMLGLRRSLAVAGESAKGKDIAEYLIKHSKCDCVGVQRKGQNAGYLLNSKTRKNFWLLA
ncbi:hypothetical protein SAY86_005740 [Trapa natans]|uniref:UspA domain-containing protein n=1 Tax=Trapa natans TaxID=22666 RepID=A0AAN7L9U9_TRANT|nr:hypothetical protein SAY86_005740 [Trapa natans]